MGSEVDSAHNFQLYKTLMAFKPPLRRRPTSQVGVTPGMATIRAECRLRGADSVTVIDGIDVGI